ncbi:hypothetical protein F0562_030710 [Nyssa sinensis]|uniref:Uncharacterized protein n=1 Tax=Nyssa sinensis TaxID=561372 RepID=A0A5J5B1P2_9ASTE|nr:hypothetical protein F0562_030710 [Nyssa sinensis]
MGYCGDDGVATGLWVMVVRLRDIGSEREKKKERSSEVGFRLVREIDAIAGGGGAAVAVVVRWRWRGGGYGCAVERWCRLCDGDRVTAGVDGDGSGGGDGWWWLVGDDEEDAAVVVVMEMMEVDAERRI